MNTDNRTKRLLDDIRVELKRLNENLEAIREKEVLAAYDRDR